jgi:predicted permease
MNTKRHWFRRRPSDDEMREELEAHVAMRAEHDGVDEAAAQRRLGNLLRTRESMRRVWIAGWWDALRQDAWFTWRSWRRRPAFALAAILILGLGLGTSTALFAALDRVLFKPLPFADPDRLVSVGLLITPAGEPPSLWMQDRSYVQLWNTPPPPFESVTATPGTGTCSIADEQPEQLSCARVESDFLRVLGVRVAAGRDFVPEDDVRGAPVVALISHGLWVRRFGADPDAVGRTLSLESRSEPVKQIPVIGVLPPDFEMPLGTADILLPFQLRPLDPDQAFNLHIMTFARLRPDVTPKRAELMLAPQLREMMASMPPSWGGAWSVQPLRERRVGDTARTAWLLVGAVAIFLLIACVNVTNLMLTRVAERQREFAMRAALGAGRTRLARLALAESLLLALTAGSVGLVVAFGLLQTFVAMAPDGVPGIADASIDMRVFVVNVSLMAISGVAIGLWPALSVFRAGGLQGLRSTSPSSPAARPRVRFALVTMQIALTLALLGGSALLLRSLWNVVNVPLGFDGERVVTLATTLSATRYPAGEQVTAFFEELLIRAQATPGAVSAALSDAPAPRGRVLARARIDVEGRPVDPAARHAVIRIREVTARYFEIFRTPLIKGRAFEDADRVREPAIVLSQSAERILFAGERALDRRVQPYPEGPWYTVVGVVADVRNGQRVIDEPEAEIYAVARRGSWGRAPAVTRGRSGQLALRTTASPVDAAGFLRQIAADLDPRLAVTIETVDEQVTRLTAQPRFVAWLLSAFAALALLLAAAGLYSVASYLVTQRRRDIAVRVAIGASPRDVAGRVVGEAGRWIIGGAAVGSALGWMGTRALQSQLYQVEALDPWSWTGALLALALALLIAVFRPAYRAAHVDPVTALRAD